MMIAIIDYSGYHHLAISSSYMEEQEEMSLSFLENITLDRPKKTVDGFFRVKERC
jgi:hypothetical protein